MFQAYILVGPGNCQHLHVKDNCIFYIGLYSEKFKQAVNEFDFSEYNTSVSTDIQYKGIIYKKGHFLVSKNDETLEFGELLIILIKNNTEVYLVMDVHKGDYHFEYHLYSVKKDVVRWSVMLLCLKISDLVDFYPLTSYVVNGHKVIPLKHSIVSK